MLSNFRRSKAMPPAMFDALVNIAAYRIRIESRAALSGQMLNKARDRS
jgi:hypothetical protein